MLKFVCYCVDDKYSPPSNHLINTIKLQKLPCLFLLDLTAIAFDTIDYPN